MINKLIILSGLLLATGTAYAQNEYAGIARLRSLNESVRGIRPTADGEHYTTLEKNNILRYSYATDAPGESLLPSPAPDLVISDYLFSPDERTILVASGRKPIYRHSYTTSYSLIRDNRVNHVCAADYTEGSEIDRLVKLIIDKIAVDFELQQLEIPR